MRLFPFFRFIARYLPRCVSLSIIGPRMDLEDRPEVRRAGIFMNSINRVHITGASGCGTTTLGRALATRLGWGVLDADDFFWMPTVPPYRQKRERTERLAMVTQAISANPKVVLSGSICGWGAELEGAFDLVVFLTVRKELRLERLRERELRKLGRLDQEFMLWAAQYDEGGLDMRSRALHERWLAGQVCPVVRLDGERPVHDLVATVIDQMERRTSN
jgi:adenylate kinase family enzyme